MVSIKMRFHRKMTSSDDGGRLTAPLPSAQALIWAQSKTVIVRRHLISRL
jgi:hypothetical protein